MQFVVGMFVPTPIQASVQSEGFTLDPIFQELTLTDEQEITATISITNDTQEPQEVAVHATDITQEQLTGKLRFTDGFQGTYPYSLAPFIRFDKDRFVIPPQETELLEVTFENRETLKPGGHYAAVVVKPQVGITTQKTTILPGLTSVFFVRKLGGVLIKHQLESLEGVSTFMIQLPETIAATLINSGNSHLIPRGTVRVTGWNSRLLLQKVFNPNSSVLFPETTRMIVEQLQFQHQPWLLEPLTLTLEYRDTTESTTISKSISGLYIHPILIISILGGAGTSYWYWRKQIHV